MKSVTCNLIAQPYSHKWIKKLKYNCVHFGKKPFFDMANYK